MDNKGQNQVILETTNELESILNDEHTFNWEKFKNFVNTYDPKIHAINKKTILNDMLYGLGISLDEKYRYFSGYKLFKQQLKKLL